MQSGAATHAASHAVLADLTYSDVTRIGGAPGLPNVWAMHSSRLEAERRMDVEPVVLDLVKERTKLAGATPGARAVLWASPSVRHHLMPGDRYSGSLVRDPHGYGAQGLAIGGTFHSLAGSCDAPRQCAFPRGDELHTGAPQQQQPFGFWYRYDMPALADFKWHAVSAAWVVNPSDKAISGGSAAFWTRPQHADDDHGTEGGVYMPVAPFYTSALMRSGFTVAPRSATALAGVDRLTPLLTVPGMTLALALYFNGANHAAMNVKGRHNYFDRLAAEAHASPFVVVELVEYTRADIVGYLTENASGGGLSGFWVHRPAHDAWLNPFGIVSEPFRFAKRPPPEPCWATATACMAAIDSW